MFIEISPNVCVRFEDIQVVESVHKDIAIIVCKSKEYSALKTSFPIKSVYDFLCYCTDNLNGPDSILPLDLFEKEAKNGTF